MYIAVTVRTNCQIIKWQKCSLTKWRTVGFSSHCTWCVLGECCITCKKKNYLEWTWVSPVWVLHQVFVCMQLIAKQVKALLCLGLRLKKLLRGCYTRMPSWILMFSHCSNSTADLREIWALLYGTFKPTDCSSCGIIEGWWGEYWYTMEPHSTADTHDITDNSESPWLSFNSLQYLIKQPLNTRHSTTPYSRQFLRSQLYTNNA